MKRILFLVSVIYILFLSGLNARTVDSTSKVILAKDTAWKAGATLSVTFSQAYFENWSAGGERSYSLNSRGSAFAKYELKKVMWENTLDLAYGFTEQQSTGFRKNDDLVEVTSKFGYRASKKWYYSAVLNVKSQFSAGYDYKQTPADTISDFLSPLIVNFALGMDCKPNKAFSAFLSPVNLKLIYVGDTVYSKRNSIDAGEHLKTEFGFIAKINYRKKLLDHVDFLTKLDVFYDYLNTTITLYDGSERLKSPYISWEVLINAKIWKTISVNLNTHLIYDENYRELDESGNAKDPKIQFKEVFGVGVALKF
ncbi:MAG: DUF3078 domain-containing protein [Bacteroidales bacterium]|jgi:hypothetical protein